MDVKGWFRTGNGQRCDPLTAVDAASRFLLVCQGLHQPRGLEVRQVLERAFREYGLLPQVIRSDNGPPFASVGLGGLSPLAVWWTKLGIVPERTAPGHPEQNGRLERLHRTLQAETASPPAASLRAQQRSFDAFRTQYNEERPHEALAQRPPASCYQPSFRRYPAQTPKVDYVAGVAVRQGRTNGRSKWRGGLVYLTQTLRGEPVGLAPQDDRYWSIRFGPMEIGLLDGLTLAPSCTSQRGCYLCAWANCYPSPRCTRGVITPPQSSPTKGEEADCPAIFIAMTQDLFGTEP